MTESEKTRQMLWDERHAARDPIESREPDETLTGLAASLEPGRALDLAAGDGRNAIWLARQGWQTTGVDFSAVGLQRAAAAAERAGVTVSWVHADLLAWEPPRRSADLVTVMFLHLPAHERRTVLAAAAEAVAAGGRLLIVGHDLSNLGQDVPGPSDPAVLYTAEDVVRDLPGLVVETAERIGHDLGDGRQSFDAVVVARRGAD